MKKSKWMLTVALVVLFLFPVGVLAEQITINWWHAHGGRLGELVNGIAEGFNESQNTYKLVATYKGNYADTMTAGIAAYRSKNPPHILAPRGCPFVHSAKLDAANRCLHFRHTAICTETIVQPAETGRMLSLIDSLPILAVIFVGPHSRPEIGIIRRQHATLATGRHYFVLAKGPRTNVTNRSD